METDTDWYNKLYDDLILIPIDCFIKDDFDLIFDDGFVEILKDSNYNWHKREIEGIEHYELLVTTTETTATHEGGQHHFQFKKVNGKLLLNEIGTIP